MRVTARVPLPPGAAFAPGASVRFDPAQLPAVRDPSLFAPVGRVVAVRIDEGAFEVELELDEALVAARLAEKRHPF